MGVDLHKPPQPKNEIQCFFGNNALPLKSTKHLKQNLLYSPYFKISFSKVTFKYGCLKLAFMMDSYATRDERKKINISQVPPTPTPHSSQSGKGGCLREKEPA